MLWLRLRPEAVVRPVFQRDSERKSAKKHTQTAQQMSAGMPWVEKVQQKKTGRNAKD